MLISLGQAVTTVGLPLYFLAQGMSAASFGLFMGIAAFFAILTSLYSPPILERYNQLRVLILTTLLSGVTFLFLGFDATIPITIMLVVVHNVGVTLATNSQGILFKDATRSKLEYRRDIGIMGSVLNLSWFIGPILGGYVLNVSGIKGLFILSGLFFMLSSLFITIQPFKTKYKLRNTIDGKLKENISYYLKNRPLRIAFVQRMGILVWWGFVWTFMPIFMLKNGYSVAQIGIFIALTQLPLFLLEFKTTIIVSRLSYRWIFLICYGALALLTITAAVVSNYSSVLVAILLGSFFLAFLEPITDLYFFDNVSLLDEERSYPLYAISNLFGSSLIKITVGATLLILSDQFAFITLAVIMAAIAYNALGIPIIAPKRNSNIRDKALPS